MTAWQKTLLTLVSVAFGGAAFAQNSSGDVDARMKAAEARMEAAAREIAELSTARLGNAPDVARRFRFDGRPLLGVNVGSDEEGPVAGVEVLAVTPGGAAAEAGLRAGDVITAVNGESLAGASAREATATLLDFMSGVEDGDVLAVAYLRNNKAAEIDVTPTSSPAGYAFALQFDGDEFHLPVAPGPPGALVNKFIWMSGASGWGDMEIVELSERLGRYFGADRGLLVVKAPENVDFKLEDGDVIRRIDGREPTSVRHAMRILGSYQSGETLKIEIMRDKRPRTLEIEMPDERQSAVSEMPARPRAVNVRRKPESGGPDQTAC